MMLNAACDYRCHGYVSDLRENDVPKGSRLELRLCSAWWGRGEFVYYIPDLEDGELGGNGSEMSTMAVAVSTILWQIVY